MPRHQKTQSEETKPTRVNKPRARCRRDGWPVLPEPAKSLKTRLRNGHSHDDSYKGNGILRGTLEQKKAGETWTEHGLRWAITVLVFYCCSDNNTRVWNRTNLLPHCSVGRRCDTDLTELESWCQQVHSFLEAWGKNRFASLFQLQAAPSSIFKAANTRMSSSSSFKNTYDHIEPTTWIIQAHLPILRSAD